MQVASVNVYGIVSDLPPRERQRERSDVPRCTDSERSRTSCARGIYHPVRCRFCRCWRCVNARYRRVASANFERGRLKNLYDYCVRHCARWRAPLIRHCYTHGLAPDRCDRVCSPNSSLESCPSFLSFALLFSTGELQIVGRREPSLTDRDQTFDHHDSLGLSTSEQD